MSQTPSQTSSKEPPDFQTPARRYSQTRSRRDLAGCPAARPSTRGSGPRPSFATCLQASRALLYFRHGPGMRRWAFAAAGVAVAIGPGFRWLGAVTSNGFLTCDADPLPNSSFQERWRQSGPIRWRRRMAGRLVYVARDDGLQLFVHELGAARSGSRSKACRMRARPPFVSPDGALGRVLS